MILLAGGKLGDHSEQAERNGGRIDDQRLDS
jgi:hypothetical protein